MATTLLVKDIAGPHCGTYDDGAKVFAAVSSIFQGSGTVNLDFAGVQTLTSSFINGAVGNLLRQFGDAFVKSHLILTPRTARDKFVLDKTLQAIRENSGAAA